MNVITIESDAYKQIMDSITSILSLLKENRKKQPLSDEWLDIQDVCQLLHISKRTLQSYRDTGIISFSQVGGKIYFKASDIEIFLEAHYIKKFKN